MYRRQLESNPNITLLSVPFENTEGIVARYMGAAFPLEDGLPPTTPGSKHVAFFHDNTQYVLTAEHMASSPNPVPEVSDALWHGVYDNIVQASTEPKAYGPAPKLPPQGRIRDSDARQAAITALLQSMPPLQPATGTSANDPTYPETQQEHAAGPTPVPSTAGDLGQALVPYHEPAPVVAAHVTSAPAQDAVPAVQPHMQHPTSSIPLNTVMALHGPRQKRSRLTSQPWLHLNIVKVERRDTSDGMVGSKQEDI